VKEKIISVKFTPKKGHNKTGRTKVVAPKRRAYGRISQEFDFSSSFLYNIRKVNFCTAHWSTAKNIFRK